VEQEEDGAYLGNREREFSGLDKGNCVRTEQDATGDFPQSGWQFPVLKNFSEDLRPNKYDEKLHQNGGAVGHANA
jgi:hypothetical protein